MSVGDSTHPSACARARACRPTCLHSLQQPPLGRPVRHSLSLSPPPMTQKVGIATATVAARSKWA
eukprot:1780567-Pleurochrysis_carterae.AAC.2